MNPRVVVLTAAIVLMVTACGGGSVSSSGEVDTTLGAVDSTVGIPDATTVAATDPGTLRSGSYGWVTIGDERYEFVFEGLGASCNLWNASNMFGSGFRVDESGSAMESSGGGGRSATLVFQVYAENYDWAGTGESPPAIEIDDNEEGQNWASGETVDLAQIDSMILEGGHATGTATFIDRAVVFAGGTPEPIPGAFEFTCAE